jgi:hypothetical protein
VNGGFYPELPVAAYKQTYVSSLRHYPRPQTPSNYCRLRTTLQGKRAQKVESPVKVDPYLLSQTFYISNQNVRRENRNARRYQITNDQRLSAPKRVEPKFKF